MRYWPRLFGEDGWILADLFLAFLWTEMPKITRPIFSRLDWTSLVNKEFIICPKTKSFLSWSTRKIPSGQDGPILKVAMRGGRRHCNCLRRGKNIYLVNFLTRPFFIISYNWCIVTQFSRHVMFATLIVRITLIKIVKFAKLQCREKFQIITWLLKIEINIAYYLWRILYIFRTVINGLKLSNRRVLYKSCLASIGLNQLSKTAQ